MIQVDTSFSNPNLVTQDAGNYLVLKILLPSKRILDAVGDWFFPLVMGGFIIARCYVHDANRRMWADEILSWFPANASFGEMLGSTTDTINGAPPVYFILAWFWTAICGRSSLALRLFSAFATAAAICLMFIVLRRAYGRLAAAAAWLVGITDSELLSNSMQARFHTLIVAEVALAILLYQRIVAQRRPSTRLLLANAATHGALVMTHYLGALFSGVILGAFVLTGIARWRSPMRACLSVAGGWMAFVPWIPIFIRHTSMAKPKIWIPVPTMQNLKDVYQYMWTEFWWLGQQIAVVGAAAFLLVILVTLFTQKPAALGWRRTIGPREIPLVLVALCLLGVPYIIYWLSVRPGGASIFQPKYFVACLLGVTILLAHVSSRAIDLCFRIPKSASRYVVLAVLVVLLSAKILRTGLDRVSEVSALPPEAPVLDVPIDHVPGEPVVIEHIHEFLKMAYYSLDRGRYVFAVDPEVGLADGAGGPLNHRIMAAMGRQFPRRFGGVKTTDEFLSSATSFWVQRGGMQWFAMRVVNNPLFEVDRTEGTLVHVRRIK